MTVTSYQNIFVLPYLGFFQAEFIGIALNLADNKPLGAWRRSAPCDVPILIFM